MNTNGLSVTVLSDNRAAYGLEAEHGFALWIETAGHKILFDTGRGGAMLRNAEALGIDLGLADCVVLSHGHYDHTGNVPAVLERSGHSRLFLQPYAVQPRYSIHDMPKPIGMPGPSVEAVQKLPEARRHWISAPAALSEHVWLTGCVSRETAYEDTGGPFFLDAEGEHADAIPDDLSLWIETRDGLVVCLGCCHAGVVNTLRHCMEVAGERRLAAVIGGTHLLHASEERLERTAEALKEYAIPHVFPCHCTGEAASAYLAEHVGSSVQPGYAGMKVSF
ncbi:MAG: MBL fold metallo-hydrolase [Kiritimatiellae bacterium]|nr:MBL fold metallo-hydrolase [Kiritimatiellia bacterium]